MISWAVETFLASTLLMLVVLAVRGPVARQFGPHIAYGLWLLPALRMLLPPLPQTVAPAPLRHALPANIEALLAAAASLHAPAVRVADAPIDGFAINWPLLLAGAWGLGAVLFLAWHICSYRRFVGTALGQATQLPRLDRDGVEVCASPAAQGPFAAGIFLKTIVLPEDYRRRYDRDELRLAIEHEVQHHRRCDMSANFVALVVLALHWWNPIAYLAHRAFRVDQELACDAVVLARATPDERHAYGSALLKSACDRLPVAACALGAGDDLKRRLKMMRTYRWNAARARLGSMIAAGLVGGGLMLTASNGIAAETTKSVERKVRVALAPVAPLPPSAPVAPPAPPAPAVRAPKVPAAPLPPAPPVPPTESSGLFTVSWTQDSSDIVDTAEIRREAQQEARQAALEARLEAAGAAREARQEARDAAREAMRSHPALMTGSCARGTIVSARVGEGGDAVVRCGTMTVEQRASVRAQVLASLQNARASVAASFDNDWARRAREQALANIDREIARLKAEK